MYVAEICIVLQVTNVPDSFVYSISSFDPGEASLALGQAGFTFLLLAKGYHVSQTRC